MLGLLVFSILFAGIMFFGGAVTIAMHNTDYGLGGQVRGLIFVMILVLIVFTLSRLVV